MALDPTIKRVTIVGTGLLGGSVGLALRLTGFKGTIVGTGSRPATLGTALAHGCVHEVQESPVQAVKGSDLVVIAAPVGKIPGILGQLSTCLESHTVVTDVGSTKFSIVTAAEAEGLEGRFVGAHPMAGSESTGPLAARADLFKGKPVILTPAGRTEPGALQKVESFWTSFGMQVFHMSPQEHDRLVAVISHLPHAVAVMLVQLAEQNGALPVASTGFADTTRLAMGDSELWADIFLDNKAAVVEALAQWAALSDRFVHVLKSNDRAALTRLLIEAQTLRTGWRDRPKGSA